jgi:hypothetical protein
MLHRAVRGAASAVPELACVLSMGRNQHAGPLRNVDLTRARKEQLYTNQSCPSGGDSSESGTCSGGGWSCGRLSWIRAYESSPLCRSCSAWVAARECGG